MDVLTAIATFGGLFYTNCALDAECKDLNIFGSLGIGVDGIITDCPDLLMEVLGR